jgi:hypothetical protein
MGFLNKVTRRKVMAAQAAVAGLAVLPGGVSASTMPDSTAPVANPVAAAHWHSATATELAPHIGERFRVSTQEYGTIVLKLVAVEAGPESVDRPEGLARRAGVVAVFDSPDMAPLVADGHGLHRVSHPRIGSADLYMVASPRRNGGSFIEIVLN